eukprot:g24666.t1
MPRTSFPTDVRHVRHVLVELWREHRCPEHFAQSSSGQSSELTLCSAAESDDRGDVDVHRIPHRPSSFEIDLDLERRKAQLMPRCQELLKEVKEKNEAQALAKALQESGFEADSRRGKRAPPAREAAQAFWACVLHRLDDAQETPRLAPLPERFDSPGTYYARFLALILSEARASASNAWWSGGSRARGSRWGKGSVSGLAWSTVKKVAKERGVNQKLLSLKVNVPEARPEWPTFRTAWLFELRLPRLPEKAALFFVERAAPGRQEPRTRSTKCMFTLKDLRVDLCGFPPAAWGWNEQTPFGSAMSLRQSAPSVYRRLQLPPWRLTPTELQHAWEKKVEGSESDSEETSTTRRSALRSAVEVPWHGQGAASPSLHRRPGGAAPGARAARALGRGGLRDGAVAHFALSLLHFELFRQAWHPDLA